MDGIGYGPRHLYQRPKMTDDEWDAQVAEVKARLALHELAMQGLKYEVARLERLKSWNPCQPLREEDINWPP